MNAFLDTNLFVYATYPQFPQFPKARDFLKSCMEGPHTWSLSWSVVYEYLRVVTHPALFSEDVLSFPKALENVTRFLSSPHVEMIQETTEHTRHLEETARGPQTLSGNILHDAHIVVLMKEHDLQTIYTADTDFNRFKNIEAVNPL